MGIKNYYNNNNPPNNNQRNSGGGNQPLPPIFPPNTSRDFDIEDLLINYNEKCKNEKPILYRDKQIFKTLATLSSKNKPNVILIGEAGCGKTKIVEDIARVIENNDEIIPKRLKNKKIYELPISSLMAETGIRGSLEEKLKKIIAFFEDESNNAILFIDEIHQLFKENNPFIEDVSQMLKPVLARGNIRIIGATTVQESKHLLNDPALNRRFSDVIVPLLKREETINIIENILPEYHKFHNVGLDPTNIKSLVDIAEKYKKVGMNRPDNAITLLDRCMADKALEFQIHKKNIITSGNQTAISAIKNIPFPILSVSDIEKSAKNLLYGDERMDENSFNETIKKLNSEIIGQNKMKEVLIKRLRSKNLGAFTEKKPLSLLFAGLTGTGKSQTAKILAKTFLCDENSIININMSEYHSPASINRIIGSPSGYVGYNSNKEMPLDSLEVNPAQIVLLDEFEKADSSVQKLFMQALDDGFIKMTTGKIINFSKAIVIATTNAGVNELSKNPIGLIKSEKSETNVIKTLKKSFPVELLNRFTDIIFFDSISKDDYKNIIILKYNKIIKDMNKNLPNLTFTPQEIDNTLVSEDLENLIETSYNRIFNGRPAEKAVKEYIEEKIFKQSNNTIIKFFSK